MAITYGYFNSVNGDRVYDANQMSEYFQGLISDGVYEKVDNALVVKAGGGMSVNVDTGRAIIKGRWLKNDSVHNIEITAANALLNRWTAIVIRVNFENRLIGIFAKDGTPAANPTKPSMLRETNRWEICLAYVYVKAGATAITQANITDMRASSLCGWVTGIVKQVDTSDLFLQWQNAYEDFYYRFEEWFAHLTATLQVNTYIKQFRIHQTFNSGRAEIVCNSSTIPGYNAEESDIIMVYVDGKLADDWQSTETPEQDEYEISWAYEGGSFVAALTHPVSKPTKVEVVIFKSIIGNPPTQGSTLGLLDITNRTESNSIINVTEGE
jgi:hypothetical protein